MSKPLSMKQSHISGLLFSSAEFRMRRSIRSHEDVNIVKSNWRAHSSTIYLEIEAVLVIT